MLKLAAVLGVFFVLVFSVFAGDAVTSSQDKVEEPKVNINIVDNIDTSESSGKGGSISVSSEAPRREKISGIKVPVPVESPPRVVVGKTIMWVVENTAKREGWSFTGYSKFGLDSDYRPWRWHFGIISGELDAHLANRLHDSRVPDYSILEDWQRERSERIAFGFCFVKRF